MSIISASGNARKGKTLKQNYLLEWLSCLEKGNGFKKRENYPNSCQNVKEVTEFISLKKGKSPNDRVHPPSGFFWSSGQKPVTRGIWMWSRFFLLDDQAGGKVAVVVLDTEGLNAAHQGDKFDTRIDAQIFAISSLISSVQVFFFYL